MEKKTMSVAARIWMKIKDRASAFWTFCKKNPSFSIGLAIMIVILFIGAFAQKLAPNDPYLSVPQDRLLPPFWMEGANPQYPLGTDYIGRCLLSRMMLGVQNSILICLLGIALSMILGIGIGIISGMSYPHITDTLLMRITDIQLGFPFIVLVIILISLVRQNIVSVAIVLALSIWAPYARNIRSSVMLEREQDYISAARVMGASRFRIATKYLGRNVFPSILPVVPMDISALIVTESLLSYMGLGIQPPSISLGNVMGDGKNYISTSWWITALPGFLIVIMAISLTLIGDALHKHYDPQQRN